MKDEAMNPVVPASESKKPRVAVIGLGSIGGIVAGCLAAYGDVDVLACVRAPLSHLTVDLPAESRHVPMRAWINPADAQPVDWVILSTKSQDTPAIAPWLEQLCTPQTRVAVLQNGIQHAQRVAPYIHGAEVVPTIVYFNGERLARDRVRLRQVANEDITVPDDAGGQAFANLFVRTPLRISLRKDFVELTWRKLLLNAAANPVTALVRQRLAVLKQADIRALCLGILNEGVQVAHANGIHLHAREAEEIMAALLTYPGEAGTSMYFDYLAGRTLEIEALNGAIVEAGEKAGIATPLNRTVLALVRAINDHVRSSQE